MRYFHSSYFSRRKLLRGYTCKSSC